MRTLEPKATQDRIVQFHGPEELTIDGEEDITVCLIHIRTEVEHLLKTYAKPAPTTFGFLSELPFV